MTATAPPAPLRSAPSSPSSASSQRPLAQRVLAWALWTGAALALTLLSAWTGAYFWLGSSSGRSQLASIAGASLPPGVQIGAIRWGPALDEVALGDVSVREPGGRELLHVSSAALDIGLGAFIGGDVVVDSLEVDLTRAEATTGADGKLDLVAALSLPSAPTVAGGPPRAGRGKTPEVKRLSVHLGEVWLGLGDLHAHLRDVQLEGSLAAAGEDPPVVQIRLATGGCHAMWNKWRRQVGFDECRLLARVQGRHVALTSLELRQVEEVLSMNGAFELAEKPKGELHAHAHLGALEANALAPGNFPSGMDFDGLELAFADGKLVGSLGQVVAERWTSGPLSADHVAFGVDRFTAEPGLLVPAMEISLDGLAAARLEGLGWGMEGLWLPRANGDLDKKLIAATGGSSSAWTLPTGVVGPIELRVGTQLKLTGGVLEAQVETARGVVEALGTLKSSPLTKRTSFVAELRFSGIGGPLAEALLHDLDADQRAVLGSGPSGSAELEVDVDRVDRFSPWVTTLEWALGRVEGTGCGGTAPGSGCTAFEWDGYGWGVAAPLAKDAPRPEEPP